MVVVAGSVVLDPSGPVTVDPPGSVDGIVPSLGADVGVSIGSAVSTGPPLDRSPSAMPTTATAMIRRATVDLRIAERYRGGRL